MQDLGRRPAERGRRRLYVHSSVHDEFVARMDAALAGISVGRGLDRSHDLGALVSVAERDKVAALVDAAVVAGATLVRGGHASRDGAFHDATLLTGVEHGSPLTATETFGPVTAVIRYDDVDEAIRMANDTVHDLIAYVFGEEHEAMSVARPLDAGMVAVNRGVVSDPAAPFGGTRQSGLGREGGQDGIHEFLEPKYTALSAWPGHARRARRPAGSRARSPGQASFRVGRYMSSHSARSSARSRPCRDAWVTCGASDRTASSSRARLTMSKTGCEGRDSTSRTSPRSAVA